MASTLFSLTFPRTPPPFILTDNISDTVTVSRPSLELGFREPPLCCSSLPLVSCFSPSSFSLLLPSVCAEEHAVHIPFFLTALYPGCQVNPLLPWVRKPASCCQLHRCPTRQSVLKCSLIIPAVLCAQYVPAAIIFHWSVVGLSRKTKPFICLFILLTLV